MAWQESASRISPIGIIDDIDLSQRLTGTDFRFIHGAWRKYLVLVFLELPRSNVNMMLIAYLRRS